jgi:hypothetical protein
MKFTSTKSDKKVIIVLVEAFVVAGPSVINTFYSRNLLLFVISYSVFPDKPFHPSLMLASKVGAYTSEATFRCSALG